MHPYFREALASEHRQRLLEDARRFTRLEPEITIRTARHEDSGGLELLSKLDEKPLGAGPWLVAEVEGGLAAALDLSDGDIIADPFRPSVHLVSLLRARAAHFAPRPGRFRRLRPAH